MPRATLLRRVPFTISIVGIILALAVAFRTVWAPLAGRPLADQVAYGLPALEDGRWWTVLTGGMFAFYPVQPASSGRPRWRRQRCGHPGAGARVTLGTYVFLAAIHLAPSPTLSTHSP